MDELRQDENDSVLRIFGAQKIALFSYNIIATGIQLLKIEK